MTKPLSAELQAQYAVDYCVILDKCNWITVGMTEDDDKFAKLGEFMSKIFEELCRPDAKQNPVGHRDWLAHNSDRIANELRRQYLLEQKRIKEGGR